MNLPMPKDFVPYEKPKKGVFNVDAGIYDSGKGWRQKQETHLIIGEDDILYVTNLKPISYGEWIGDKVVNRNAIIALGINKSRLVKWTPTQLDLF